MKYTKRVVVFIQAVVIICTTMIYSAFISIFIDGETDGSDVSWWIWNDL